SAACTSIATSVANLPSRFAEYEVEKDLVFDATQGLALDVYRPVDENGPRPVVVFWHGGGWDNGSKDQYLFVGEALVSLGYVAVVPSYRLYPNVQFPAFVDDAATAVAWVRKNIERYGGDPDQLWLMGHSAGAHIAALLAFDERYLAAAGVPRCALSGFIGLAGPYDFLPFGSDRLRAIFAPAAEPELTQPVTFVDGSEPPALLLHGEQDERVLPRNSRRLATRIREQGGTVFESYYPDLDHAGIVASLTRYFRDDREVLERVGEFIESCGGGSTECERGC
ncbi:MAG TPA: alpha/beta hydrolase, partial [Steroidobacteraceae bacterium]|nr:alpha/beta hydrolase [Steroidobacteraceae bacterium]